MSVYSSDVTPTTSFTDDLWNNLRKDVLERHLSGDLLARPAPDGYGLFFFVKSGGDEKLYYSDGANWYEVGHQDIAELAFFLGLLGGSI